MIASHKQVQILFDPWPIQVKKGYYQFSIIPFYKALRLKSCWKSTGKEYSKSPAGKRFSIKTFAKWVENADWGLNIRHNTRAMARKRCEQKWILVYDNKIYDGNHSMCSLWLRKYRGPIMVIEYIGRKKR